MRGSILAKQFDMITKCRVLLIVCLLLIDYYGDVILLVAAAAADVDVDAK